jgi:hypothetical protein
VRKNKAFSEKHKIIRMMLNKAGVCDVPKPLIKLEYASCDALMYDL